MLNYNFSLLNYIWYNILIKIIYFNFIFYFKNLRFIFYNIKQQLVKNFLIKNKILFSEFYKVYKKIYFLYIFFYKNERKKKERHLYFLNNKLIKKIY